MACDGESFETIEDAKVAAVLGWLHADAAKLHRRSLVFAKDHAFEDPLVEKAYWEAGRLLERALEEWHTTPRPAVAKR